MAAERALTNEGDGAESAQRPVAPRVRNLDEVRPLCREDLANGSALQTFLRSRVGVWSDAQLEQSLDETLNRAPPGDVWLFAYGSLIWNPLVPVAEERVARVHGLHRSFCVRTELGRGSPERPGLVLGLDRGGVCQGVVLRLEAHHAREELAMVWRREMVTGAYKPTWVKARTATGAVHAIAFVVDRLRKSYVGRLDEDEVVGILSCAVGFLGPCTDYLAQTVAGLATRGIHDPLLERLAERCGCAPTTQEP